MKVLVVIPHFYDAAGGGRHGSRSAGNEGDRVAALAATIDGLHTSLGDRHVAFDIAARVARPANQSEGCALDVVVVTTGAQHLLSAVPLPHGLWRHEETDEDGWMLGFACRRVLAEGLHRYDMFCFLEDDLVIADPLFLRKLAWFRSLAGDDKVLQPNRFEADARALAHKAYVDGDLLASVLAPHVSPANDPALLPDLGGKVMGAPLRFVPARNPHGGCCFLSASQMERLVADPRFALRDTSFVGPLESAVTLPLLRNFQVYKPAPENASFLEVRHFGSGFLALLRSGN